MLKIYNLTNVLDFLVNVNRYQIFLTYKNTNYNTQRMVLYLDYKDLPKLKSLLFIPFKLVISKKIKKNYIWDYQKKKLTINEVIFKELESENKPQQKKPSWLKEIQKSWQS